MSAKGVARVAAVRRFNRFYTKKIGVLRGQMLNSPFSLTELRVLYELAHRDRLTATAVAAELGLDAGYLSRILRRFARQRLVERNASEADGRQTLLSLTTKGRQAFSTLDVRSGKEIAAMIGRLSARHQERLVSAMQTIEDLLEPPAPSPGEPSYVLRSHQPGDMGWVVHRHGVLYAQEYGYDEEFEALVATIVAHFIEHFDPKRERCWIAERQGEIVGSVFLVHKTATVAKLRLLLVEPSARGLGIGRRLIHECVRFGRQVGYQKITLWTHSELTAARRLYEGAGFRRVGRHRHYSFGKNLVAETWAMPLRRA